MSWNLRTGLLLLFALLLASRGQAADTKPKPIPATRPEAKQALEDLKKRTPRLPLPPASEEEGQAANNGRMRALYLPPEVRGGERRERTPAERAGGLTTRRPRDPNATLDYDFTVELFWIASRANNCHYCLGHQETKLRSAGLEEARIAALDCDWSRFTPAEQAAYELAKKLTLRPDQLTDKDFAAVSKHYTPLQVLEMVMMVARYNATNRWTDGLGIPQESHRELLTTTPEEFSETRTIVAPAEAIDRGPLPTAKEVQRQWQLSRERQARLPLLEDEPARKVLAEHAPEGKLPHWMRLVAHFPTMGVSQVDAYERARENGAISPELKAQIAWVAARHDRAWYALDQARKRLEGLGYSADKMFALDALAEQATGGTGAALSLARKSTVAPQAISDADIAALREHFSDAQVAEIMYHVTLAASFNRVTEAAALPLD